MTGSFNEKVTGNIPYFHEKSHWKYTSGSMTRILGILPSVAIDFEYITVNVDFHCPRFRISCDLICFIKTVRNIPFLELQGHRKELINLWSKNDG